MSQTQNGNQAEENINWGDVMKMQADAQKQQDVFNLYQKKDLQSNYRNELKKQIEDENKKKLAQRFKDENARKMMEKNTQIIEEREKKQKFDRMHLEDEVLKEALKEDELAKEKRKHMSEVEKQQYNNYVKQQEDYHRAREKKEREKRKLQQDEFNDIYQRQMQENFEKTWKEKEMDKKFRVENSTFGKQDELRQKLLTKIKGGFAQNHEVLRQYDRLYNDIIYKRQEFEKNMVDKAAAEKIRKDEEQFRINEEKRRKMNTDFTNANEKLLYDKRYESMTQKQRELDTEQRKIRDTLEQYEMQKRYEKMITDQIKGATLSALNKQMEEKSRMKKYKDQLDPREAGLNKHSIQVLDQTRKGQFDNMMKEPISVPGLGFDHQRVRQENYLKKYVQRQFDNAPHASFKVTLLDNPSESQLPRLNIPQANNHQRFASVDGQITPTQKNAVQEHFGNQSQLRKNYSQSSLRQQEGPNNNYLSNPMLHPIHTDRMASKDIKYMMDIRSSANFPVRSNNNSEQNSKRVKDEYQLNNVQHTMPDRYQNNSATPIMMSNRIKTDFTDSPAPLKSDSGSYSLRKSRVPSWAYGQSYNIINNSLK